MGFTVKKIVMYSIDLEPIKKEDFKDLMEQYVGSRISTNSLFVYESFEEKEFEEEMAAHCSPHYPNLSKEEITAKYKDKRLWRF